jgi:hypothetical protein
MGYQNEAPSSGSLQLNTRMCRCQYIGTMESSVTQAVALPSPAASRQKGHRHDGRLRNGTAATFLLLVFLVSWMQALADELGDAAEGARPSLGQEVSIGTISGRLGTSFSVGAKDFRVSAISFSSRAQLPDSECASSAGAPCCSNPGEDCHCPRACAEIHTLELPATVVEVSGEPIAVRMNSTDFVEHLTSAPPATSIRPPILLLS